MIKTSFLLTQRRVSSYGNEAGKASEEGKKIEFGTKWRSKFQRMAVLRQGSVISATVEQSLGNCLLVSFKHRSRTFRGVLFDEKNSAVSR